MRAQERLVKRDDELPSPQYRVVAGTLGRALRDEQREGHGVLSPDSRASTDSMECVGQLPSRGFGAVSHQGNAQGGHGGEGSPTLLKGWKSTAQCSKCSNWPSTYTTDFSCLCRSAALAALDHAHAEAGEIRATSSCPPIRPTLLRTKRLDPHHPRASAAFQRPWCTPTRVGDMDTGPSKD